MHVCCNLRECTIEEEVSKVFLLGWSIVVCFHTLPLHYCEDPGVAQQSSKRCVHTRQQATASYRPQLLPLIPHIIRLLCPRKSKEFRFWSYRSLALESRIMQQLLTILGENFANFSSIAHSLDDECGLSCHPVYRRVYRHTTSRLPTCTHLCIIIPR